MEKNCKHCGAKNEEDARFCGNCGKKLRIKLRSILMWIFVVMLFIILAGQLTVNEELVDENKYLVDKNADLEITNSDLRKDVSVLSELLQDVLSSSPQLRRKYPIIITGIDIANVYEDGSIETDFGGTIYENNTMYLQPRIKYIGFEPQTLHLYYKLINPDGKVLCGEEYPKGYTYDKVCFIENTRGKEVYDEPFNCGDGHKGFWSSGEYTIEIWCDRVCLKAKKFAIYKVNYHGLE